MPDVCVLLHRWVRESLLIRRHLSKDLQEIRELGMKISGEAFPPTGTIRVKAPRWEQTGGVWGIRGTVPL